MAGKPIVEPMNATSNHPKLRTTLRFAEPQFIAGNVVSGKMEMECKAEKGLAVGVVKVELFGIEELTSRDHSATQTFLHTERIFQGPGLPPSNSVHPYPPAGEAVLPHHFYYARKGVTTFLFRLPLPSSSPSSISFGSGLAQIKYEVRATVEVIWKGQKQIVTDKKKVDVIESYEGGPERHQSEGIVVSENGKLWVQGKLLGGVVIPGQPACVELTVKNHSTKMNSSLAVSLTRELILPNFPPTNKPPLQLSDTLASVTFRGPEYIIQPGVEGVAHLVFDVPQTARSVRGGRRQSAGSTNSSIAALFEVQCSAVVKLVMGIGSKDIQLALPARICHPDTIPEDVFADSQMDFNINHEEYSPPYSPGPYVSSPTPNPYLVSASPIPYLPPLSPPNPYIAAPISPTVLPLSYVDQGQVWLSSPIPGSLYNPYSTPPPQMQQYQYVSTPPEALQAYPVRPSSAQPIPSSPFYPQPPGLPASLLPQTMVPLTWMATQQTPERTPEREEGKGDKATRISHHLRLSSRHRSVSPPSHRYALPATDTAGVSADELLTTPPHLTQKHSPFGSLQATPSPENRHTGLPNLSPAASEVASPRPGFSPRHSFSVDPITHATLTKRDCVEVLENIAAATNDVNADMSRSIPDLSPVDKTLPGPPVPSSRNKPNRADLRPRADTIFQQDETDLDVAPPTPTLAAVMSPPKALRSAQGLSGLDALEARLTAEVGTRKVDQDHKKPHVKAILPISIPRPTDVIDLPVDSAISSLSLPSLGANEGTLRLSAGSRPNSPGNPKSQSHGQDVIVKSRSREEPPRKRKPDDPSEKEHHRLRKMAQGRVTAWLGSIDPEAPPQSATPPMHTPPTNNASLPAQSTKADAARPNDIPPSPLTKGTDEAVGTPPNPRSSGFMPIGTLKSTQMKSSPGISPASKNDKPARNKLPRGVVFPPRPSDPELRYDPRSARGGRGGKVTAVTAIWASATSSPDPQPLASSDRNTPRPGGNVRKMTHANAVASPGEKPIAKQLKIPHATAAPSPSEAAVHHARVIKATSVPAVVSTSLATPVLSSTASLARPVRIGARPNIEKVPPAAPKTGTPNIASPKTELAFGQARLRDLIKKYQG